MWSECCLCAVMIACVTRRPSSHRPAFHALLIEWQTCVAISLLKGARAYRCRKTAASLCADARLSCEPGALVGWRRFILARRGLHSCLRPPISSGKYAVANLSLRATHDLPSLRFYEVGEVARLQLCAPMHWHWQYRGRRRIVTAMLRPAACCKSGSLVRHERGKA